ncbi:MAG TPA: efflux transporter outer membrane subunit [Steroidobacteraceae bacterium]|jgi:multidrug efflux system outer membrane protein|nr:efflux transporter outer membrane subunit [Steroidobacteraceae bacterium]
MIRPLTFLAASALLSGLLGACTMAPRYHRPEAPVPAAYEQVEPAATTAAAVPAAEIGWKEFFPDPELQDLIGRALLNNRDLRIATLNVEAARAQYRIQRADLVPPVDVTGTANNQRLPPSVSPSGQDQLTRSYSAGLSVPAFELDLFGRVRSLRRSSLEAFFALEENRTAAQLLLVSEVANAWLTLIADRELLKLAENTRDSQKKSFDLTQLRFDQGVSSEIDLHRSETSWRQAEVDIAQQTRRVAQDRNALALLVGEALPAQSGSSARDIGAQTFSKRLPAGLPAELLTRRPDVRAAEHALLAANANIGAARAAFFPSIELTGFYGNASDDLSSLFQSGHTAWSFVPQVRLPIFSGGANLAALDLANVRKRIEIARYEQSIQAAFRDVADALVARSTLADQLRAQEALTRAAEASYQLADMRYRGGVESYLGALIAQRDMYDAQRGLIVTRLADATNLVQLYQALGGGWKE